MKHCTPCLISVSVIDVVCVCYCCSIIIPSLWRSALQDDTDTFVYVLLTVYSLTQSAAG